MKYEMIEWYQVVLCCHAPDDYSHVSSLRRFKPTRHYEVARNQLYDALQWHHQEALDRTKDPDFDPNEDRIVYCGRIEHYFEVKPS